MLDNARRRAKAANVPFDLKLKDIDAAWPRDGRCPALGIAFAPGERVQGANSPSLDRMVPEWGYVPGNIAVISVRANRIKSDGRASELEAVAAWMRSRGLD